MATNFKCKADDNGYCRQWLRSCVGWENCNLKGYGAPCPGCTASSPVEDEQCRDCDHMSWKRNNYIN